MIIFCSVYLYVILLSIMLLQNMSADSIASINMNNIKAFAETFLADPNKHVEWLANSGSGSRFSKTLFLLIVLQTLVSTEGMPIFAVHFAIPFS